MCSSLYPIFFLHLPTPTMLVYSIFRPPLHLPPSWTNIFVDKPSVVTSDETKKQSICNTAIFRVQRVAAENLYLANLL